MWPYRVVTPEHITLLSRGVVFRLKSLLVKSKCRREVCDRLFSLSVIIYKLGRISHEYFLLSIIQDIFSFHSGRGGSAGGKFRISIGLPVGAVINCADNTGKNSYSSEHQLFLLRLIGNYYLFFPIQVAKICILYQSLASRDD